jgi:hypothetical protein
MTLYLAHQTETTPLKMNTTTNINCAINGNEIIVNGICTERVVMMSKAASDGSVSRKFVGQTTLNACMKTYPVERNLGQAERTFSKGEKVPSYLA